MLHHDEIAPREVSRRTDAAVLHERIKIQLRTCGNLPVVLDRLNRIAVSLEQCRGGDHQLQFEAGMLADRLQRGTDARVAGTSGYDDADLSLGHASPSISSAASSWSTVTGRARRRPMTS